MFETPDQVSVWWMELPQQTAALMPYWRASLDDAERAQADRFYFEQDRSTYAAAHWLLRRALAAAGGLPPQAWRFSVEPRGKPQLDPALGRPELKFNLSHSRGFVACAVGCGGALGIDVEALSRPQAGPEIADRFFSPREVALLRAAPAALQAEIFFRFWTLKEAFIKATGEGLHRSLDSFSFSLDPLAIAFDPADADVPEQWSFREHRPTPRHRLALAVRHPASRPLQLTLHPVAADAG